MLRLHHSTDGFAGQTFKRRERESLIAEIRTSCIADVSRILSLVNVCVLITLPRQKGLQKTAELRHQVYVFHNVQTSSCPKSLDRKVN